MLIDGVSTKSIGSKTLQTDINLIEFPASIAHNSNITRQSSNNTSQSSNSSTIINSKSCGCNTLTAAFTTTTANSISIPSTNRRTISPNLSNINTNDRR